MSNGNGHSNGNGKRGAPEGNNHASKYRDVYPIVAEAFFAKGKTEEELATALDVSHNTIANWKKSYPEFAAAYEVNKLITVSKAEKTLLECALGFEYEEREIITYKDKDGAKVERVKIFKKKALPDKTALFFYLQNRCGEDWKNVSRVEVTGKESNPIQIETLQKLTPEQLKQIAEWIAAAPKPEAPEPS